MLMLPNTFDLLNSRTRQDNSLTHNHHHNRKTLLLCPPAAAAAPQTPPARLPARTHHPPPSTWLCAGAKEAEGVVQCLHVGQYTIFLHVGAVHVGREEETKAQHRLKKQSRAVKCSSSKCYSCFGGVIDTQQHRAIGHARFVQKGQSGCWGAARELGVKLQQTPCKSSTCLLKFNTRLSLSLPNTALTTFRICLLPNFFSGGLRVVLLSPQPQQQPTHAQVLHTPPFTRLHTIQRLHTSLRSANGTRP